MISNSISYYVKDSSPNSLNFNGIPLDLYEFDVSKASQIEDFLNNQIKKIQMENYDEFYSYLTESSKKKFSNSVDVLKKELTENYIGKDASCDIQNFGVDNDNKIFIFRLKIGLPPVATDEMLKLKAYQEKFIYLGVIEGEKGNYQIEWDYSF